MKHSWEGSCPVSRGPYEFYIPLPVIYSEIFTTFPHHVPHAWTPTDTRVHSVPTFPRHTSHSKLPSEHKRCKINTVFSSIFRKHIGHGQPNLSLARAAPLNR